MNYEVIAKEVIKKGYKSASKKDNRFTVNPILNTNRDRVMSLGNGKYMLVDTYVKSCASYSPSDSNYKKASDFIKSSELSKLDNEELVLLELIVNFRLPLVTGEVCFADILDKLEVEISEEEKRYPQLIDKDILRKKLDELNEQIQNEAMQDQAQTLENEDDSLLRRMESYAEAIEALLAEPGDKVAVDDVIVLGEFIPGCKPKVVIYYKNILDNYQEWEVVLAGVFVHEMFHAWNYFKAGRKSRSVLAIDEPMVEFESLYFLKKLDDFTSSLSHPQRKKVREVREDREDRVQKKQQSIGNQAAYGFGYCLFNDLKDYDYESRQWIETYSRKSGFINKIDRPMYMAKEALIPVYPFKLEKNVMEYFREIIFDVYTIPAIAGKPVVAKVGLDVLLRDLVLACIETIAPKSFDAKELYTSFKPILDVCLQSCENLEDALKWQLDELVKEGILEALPHDCYREK